MVFHEFQCFLKMKVSFLLYLFFKRSKRVLFITFFILLLIFFWKNRESNFMEWLFNKIFLTPSFELLLGLQIDSWTSKTIRWFQVPCWYKKVNGTHTGVAWSADEYLPAISAVVLLPFLYRHGSWNHPIAFVSGIRNWTKELNEKVTIPFFWNRYFFLKGTELNEERGAI